MSGPQFMPFYVGDYLRDTQHLTAEQHGAYLLLLMACWTRGALPDNPRELAEIARLTPYKWKNFCELFGRFFKKNPDGFWHQKRVDKEQQKAEIIRVARSKAGSKSAAKRQQKVNSRARLTTATATAKEGRDSDVSLPVENLENSLLTPLSPPSRGGRARARVRGRAAKKSPREVQTEAFFHAAAEYNRDR